MCAKNVRHTRQADVSQFSSQEFMSKVFWVCFTTNKMLFFFNMSTCLTSF